LRNIRDTFYHNAEFCVNQLATAASQAIALLPVPFLSAFMGGRETGYEPYLEMNGGYASHLGIDPRYFTALDMTERGKQFRDRVITPLFFNQKNKNPAPYYLYVNVTTPEMLQKVLAEPKKYAPQRRIHHAYPRYFC
jgi:hypothetical protein